MRSVSEVVRQSTLSLSSQRAVLKKENPRCQTCRMGRGEISVDETLPLDAQAWLFSGDRELSGEYSEIARWARKFQRALGERLKKPNHDINVAVRIVCSDRVVFGEGASEPTKKSHLALVLLRAGWKLESGYFAGDEILIDFERTQIDEACSRILTPHEEGMRKRNQRERELTGDTCLLPAAITAKIIKVCTSVLIRFGGLGRQILDTPFELIDCVGHGDIKLAHTFDMAGQDCEAFSILPHLDGYALATDGSMATAYGTLRRDPWRLTFTSAPRAIVAARNVGPSDGREYGHVIMSASPLVHEEFLSSALLGFELRGYERGSGLPVKAILRGYPDELLGRIRLVGNRSYSMCGDCPVGAYDAVLSL